MAKAMRFAFAAVSIGSIAVLGSSLAQSTRPDRARAAYPFATRPAATDPVPEVVRHMTLRQKIGQMLMVSFSGTSLDQNTINMLRTFQPGGITLFGDNFRSTGQLTRLDAALQAHSRIPLFISVDQEGGEVRRITSGVKNLPSEKYYGQVGKAKLVYSDTATEAGQLRQLGINMNLAPVLDVASNPNSIIASEDRSFGPKAGLDAVLGLASIHGYQSHGIAATAKHVLGLGTTATNPEVKLPVISLSQTELRQQLLPFKKAAEAGVDSIMVTHVILKGVTSNTTPASLSHNVVTGILRDQFHYRGVLMTDSLTMGALAGRWPIGQACAMAINAGEDILLIASGGAIGGSTLSNAMNAVANKTARGKIKVGAINASVTRILELKRRLHLKLPG